MNILKSIVDSEYKELVKGCQKYLGIYDNMKQESLESGYNIIADYENFYLEIN